MVSVAGNYKPGRVTATVTDLVVPATGLAINIQRTYDSLNAGTSGDFGYGWNLGINVNLVVDNLGNVTFTLGGQRKTFDLTPAMPPCSGLVCLFPYYYVAYTPEPGLHGTLNDGGPACPLEILVPDGSLWDCHGGGQYTPTQYIYTDPNGTSYTISAAGNLQSMQDRSGNGLTITPSGITSTTGLSVPFVRDARIASRRSPIRRATSISMATTAAAISPPSPIRQQRRPPRYAPTQPSPTPAPIPTTQITCIPAARTLSATFCPPRLITRAAHSIPMGIH